jgi:hypothetical protein
MNKTASAVLAAVAAVCGLLGLVLGLQSATGLALEAAALFAGWMALVSRTLGREFAAAIAFVLRGPTPFP